MTRPGGGPPRRGHIKSRNGCETCKRRHIRCDEGFPQCSNCTKHKSRCPYNDMQGSPDRAATPDEPDLMWTPQITTDITEWQRTRTFPFPFLGDYPIIEPQFYSVEDLRLIYHLAALYHQLAGMEANNLTLWTRHIPTQVIHTY
ncbi:Zn(2)-C6 fungal-type DNA-binding domain protein [Beauveria brongniartii RCEF 3172]|uniref:Zn(2)-C6 fungal-type DNA-binding domain protein n=1 Tax=Beauveria brongniartii RCEF 3172 TaxID=1081107 RepID=A0A162M5K6_9HYPO|nr:Zn(2)-C6 fungal-type DNA-binding domain protein [Beauveria brongniartii RCEF 3172]